MAVAWRELNVLKVILLKVVFGMIVVFLTGLLIIMIGVKDESLLIYLKNDV